MIKLTRRDGSEIFINPDLIEIVEETPDTHITLSNGNRYLVFEKAHVIIEKIVLYKAKIIHRSGQSPWKKYLQKSRIENFKPLYDQEKEFKQ
jgi:flagellar protein FlbD